MPTQHFFVEGAYLGNCTRVSHFVMGELQSPRGFFFFCPVCSELWAKAPIEGQPSAVFTKPCRKHKMPACRVTGSMWMPLEPEFIKSLPAAVLEWEFERHLVYLEEQNDRSNS